MIKRADKSNSRGLIFQADINWTLQQAQDEQARAETAGINGPDSPLFQWVALNEIEQLRRQFEMGDDFALLQAIAKCAQNKLLMPNWISENYLRRYRRVLHADVGTWDEAFGRPYPKGKHLVKLRQRRELRFAVYNEISTRLNATPETAIDDALFESVGSNFQIGKTLCNELYYEALQWLNGGSPAFGMKVAGELLKPFAVKQKIPAAKSKD